MFGGGKIMIKISKEKTVNLKTCFGQLYIVDINKPVIKMMIA